MRSFLRQYWIRIVFVIAVIAYMLMLTFFPEYLPGPNTKNTKLSAEGECISGIRSAHLKFLAEYYELHSQFPSKEDTEAIDKTDKQAVQECYEKFRPFYKETAERMKEFERELEREKIRGLVGEDPDQLSKQGECILSIESVHKRTLEEYYKFPSEFLNEEDLKFFEENRKQRIQECRDNY